MRRFTRKAATLAAVGAVASGMFVLATPASAVCYPIKTTTPSTEVAPCASLVGNCANARVYYRAGVSGSIGPSQPVCLP